jgi:predicted heme/steroid binding protein
MDNQTGDKSSLYLVGALLLGAVLVATGLVVLITSQGNNTTSNLAATTPQTPQSGTPANNTNGNGAAEQNNNTQNNASDLTLSLSELGLFDGKGEKACYVAVAGTIYEISGSSLWKDGVHTIAGREITCGQDLTEEMRGAPHGTSKLSSPFMTEVGKLQ